MAPASRQPPRPAVWLASRLLPRWEREEILGDLHEAFTVRAAQSQVRARLWYWGQVGLFAGQGLVDRVRDPIGERRRWLEESVGRDPIRRGREERGWEVTTMAAGLVQATRRLAKDWRFSASMTLILGVGIGAGLIGWSVLDRVLMQPLPYEDADRLGLVRVDLGQIQNHPGLAQAEVADMRALDGAFVGAEAARAEFTATLERGEGYEPVLASGVSTGMLDLLGVAPVLGRSFGPRDDEDLDGEVILVSHAFWQSHLGGAPDAVGQTLNLNGRPRPVVGVLPEDFALHLGAGGNVSADVQVWFVQSIDPTARNFWGYRTVVRLAEGRTFEQVNEALEGLATRLLAEDPDAYGDADLRFVVHDLHADLTAGVRPAINAALASIVLLLLVAFANSASLMLGRQRAREMDLAVRSALGAGRSRLVGTVLGEGLILALAAGLLGGVLASWAVYALRALDPPGIPRWSDLGVDWSFLVAALGLAALGFIASGFYPAWRASGASGWKLIRGETSTRGTSSATLRSTLVGVQLALAVVLIFSALVLGRSTARLAAVDLGYEPEQALTMAVPIDGGQFDSPSDEGVFLRQLTERIEAIPGVTSAGAVSHVPLYGYAPTDAFSGIDVDSLNWENKLANYFSTVPGYLETIGVEFRTGRDLLNEDLEERRPVAVVDASLAETLFPGENAVGRVFKAGWGLPDLEIVGVIRHPRVMDARSEVRPQVYVPATLFRWRPLYYVVRHDGDGVGLGEAVRAEADAAGTGRAVYDVRPLDGYLADATSALRLTLTLITVLAGLTAVLAAFGLFSVMMYVAYRARRASAIRSALGATRGELLRHHLSGGTRILLGAIPVGLLLAVVGARLLQTIVYDVSTYDAVSLLVAAVVAAGVGVVATWLPAQSAASADPMETLRAEG
ncbi:MAG: ABC transporter permease [Gemmatimonadota bacterium]